MGQKHRGVQAAVMAAVTSLLGLHGALLQHLEPSSREQQRDTMRTQSRGSVFETWFSLRPT